MKIVIFFLLPLAFLTGLTLSARAETDYFPPGVWGDGPWETTAVENDERYENWYGKNLAAMNEKRLWDQQARDKATMSVRLLFLPTFDDPAMLQFSLLVDGSISYVFKGLDGKSCYELGANSYIVKPVEHENFFQTIKEIGGSIQRAQRFPGFPKRRIR